MYATTTAFFCVYCVFLVGHYRMPIGLPTLLSTAMNMQWPSWWPINIFLPLWNSRTPLHPRLLSPPPRSPLDSCLQHLLLLILSKYSMLLTACYPSCFFFDRFLLYYDYAIIYVSVLLFYSVCTV